MHTSAAAESPVQQHWHPESDALLIAFSGFGAGMGIGHDVAFHFTQSTADLPINRLLVRDLDRVWYHNGLRNLARNIDETAEYFQRTMDRKNIRRLVVMGASSGGYAALLFGRILKADDILAISPRTFLDVDNRLEHGDERLVQFCVKLYDTPERQEQYFDLTALAIEELPARSRVEIMYGQRERLDSLHAERLHGAATGWPTLRLQPFDLGGHFVGVHLTKTGILNEYLNRALKL